MHVNKRWLERKSKRRVVAVQRTGDNTYWIHNREWVARLLAMQHKVKQAVATKLGLPPPTEGDLELARRRNTRRYLRFIGCTSKYRPHQGAKECARRARG